MKKTLTLLLALAMATAGAMAKDAKDIIKKYQDTEKVEHVHIPPVLMKLARMSAKKNDKDKTTQLVLKSIKSMDILCMDDCKKAVKERVTKDFDNLESEGYEHFLSTSSDKEKVKIMMLEKKEAIRELVLLIHDDDDCTLILLEGEMSPEDIQTIVDSQTQDK